MEKVYAFVKQFLLLEAEVTTRKRIRNIEAYNKVLQEYYTFLLTDVQGATGHMPMDKPLSDIEYEMLAGYPDDTPREIFKISEYESTKYGKVYIVFVSDRNFNGVHKRMQDAFIVIGENGKLKIASSLLFTNYNKMGDRSAPYRWDVMWGNIGLNFETLKNPVNIERYLAPSSWEPGLIQYNANI